MAPQRVSQAIRHVQALFGFVKCPRSAMEPVIAESREDVKMEMPDVLITSGTIVLTSGDALTSKCILQCARDQASRTEEVFTQVVGNIQHILVVNPRDNETVAADTRVVVQRYEGKDTRFHQDDRVLPRRLIQ